MSDKYFYRPLAAYNGKVFKCAGICNASNIDMANELYIKNSDPVYLPGFVVLDGYKGDKVVIDRDNNAKEFKAGDAVPASGFDALKAEIMFLLNAAMVRPQDDEPENMAWRLADAAGLLREAIPPKAGEDLIGRDEPTGRGYVLPIKERGPANPVCLVEVRNVYGNEMIYPANRQAELFANLAGKKTLSQSDLSLITQLGFVVQEANPNKLAA